MGGWPRLPSMRGGAALAWRFDGVNMALELRPNCDYCDRDLPPDSFDARICSYECTVCAGGVDGPLGNVCLDCRWQKGPHRRSAWASPTGARRSLSSSTRSRRSRPNAGDCRLPRRRGLGAHLRFADIVDIVDVVAEI